MGDTVTTKLAVTYRAGREAYRRDLGILPLTGLVLFAINLYGHHVRSAIIALLVFSVAPLLRQFSKHAFTRRR
jgi:hypothetical protein